MRTRPLLTGLTAVLLLLATVPPADADPARDASTAMRYGASAPLGSEIVSLGNIDDDSEDVQLPFTINFFGTEYEWLCITENGGVYPRQTQGADDSCGRYDQPLGVLAHSGNAPIIASLAADHSTYWTRRPTSAFGPYPAIYAGSTTINDGGVNKAAFVVT